MAALICCVVSVGAMAQKRGQQDPPPKREDPPKVKVEPKDPPPDRKEPKGDDRKRP